MTPRRWLCLLAAWGSFGLGQAAPSTFGPIIGNALLCRSHLDNAYFYAYLGDAFGPPYKHEGGAYWFKADASLWGASIVDVMVSDDSSALVFIGAVADSTPSDLDESIRAAVGIRHQAGAAPFSILQAVAGSKIAYFKNKSKLYCARYKSLPP